MHGLGSAVGLSPAPYRARTLVAQSAIATPAPAVIPASAAPAPAAPAPAPAAPAPAQTSALIGITPRPYAASAGAQASVRAPVSAPTTTAPAATPVTAPVVTGDRRQPLVTPGAGTLLAPGTILVRPRAGGLGSAGLATASGQAAQSKSALLNKPKFNKLLAVFNTRQTSLEDNSAEVIRKAKLRSTDSDYKSARAELAVLLDMPANGTTNKVKERLKQLGIGNECAEAKDRPASFGREYLARIKDLLTSGKITCEKAGVLELSISPKLWEHMLGQLSKEELRSLLTDTLVKMPVICGKSVKTPVYIAYGNKA